MVHPPFKLLLYAFLLLSFCVSCAQVENPCRDAIDYSNNEANKGVDLNDLFEKPSLEELQIIQTTWDNFDISSTDVKIVEELTIIQQSRSRQVKVVVHESENRQHYGGIIYPLDFDSNRSYPLMIWAEGLDQNNPMVNLEKGYGVGFSELIVDHFVLIPSFRGQSLNTNNGIYCSGGFFGDAYDGATDDALRFMQVALDLLDTSVDRERLSIYGGSRGGTVALLAGVRYPSFSKVVSQSGPVQFHNRECYNRYNFQFKYQFLNQKQSISALRQKLIECSPIYFMDNYKNELFIAHGKKDPIVPLWNAELVVDARGKGNKLEVLFTDEGHFVRAAEKIANWLQKN